jgi:hypothetical protein
MNIKTATRIAIIGVALAVVMIAASPFVTSLVVPDGSTHQQAARNWTFYRAAEGVFAGVGILTFLVVLASKQKDKP